jgi:hypothetical protein
MSAACTSHPATDVCPACPGVTATDGVGFPHPSVAGERRAVQRCRRCRRLVPRLKWWHAPAKAFFGCVSCARRAGAK